MSWYYNHPTMPTFLPPTELENIESIWEDLEELVQKETQSLQNNLGLLSSLPYMERFFCKKSSTSNQHLEGHEKDINHPICGSHEDEEASGPTLE